MKTYLGDGVYASFDGYQVWLQAEVEGRTHTIALEGSVAANLVQFIKDVRAGKVSIIDAPR